MKALRYRGPGSVAIEEMPAPTPGPGEVLVEVAACGICATDVKTYRRGHPKIAPGSVLGHEVAGVVTESRHEGWTPGDRVVVAPYVNCETCAACRRGSPTLCERLFDAATDPGGFAERLRVPAVLAERGMWRLPPGLDFAEATLAEPVACTIHGLDALDLRPGSRLLVVGDGPMGVLHAALARGAGATWVGLLGRIPDRLAIARNFADLVIDTSDGRSIRDALGGVAPVDRIAVTVPDAALVDEAVAVVAGAGVVSLFAGLPSGTRLDLDAHRIHYDEVRVVGTFGFAPEHFGRAVARLADASLGLARLVTDRVALAEAPSALEAAAAYRSFKTVVDPRTAVS